MTLSGSKLPIMFPDGMFKVSVADDGVGLPAGFDTAKTDSLGMWTICSLLNQIGEELASDTSLSGTRFVISAKG